MAVDLAQVIPPLVRANVDFILIGGMAAILHGSARVTFDVDLIYSRTLEKHRAPRRRASAVSAVSPRCRAEPGIRMGREND